jgi:chemotaxis protein methyltransferase CheR
MQPGSDGVDVERLGPAFDELKTFIVTTTGHARLSVKNDLLVEKITRRLGPNGLSSFEAYLDLLKHAPHGKTELDNLIADLTVGETSFFRHPEQFDALRDHVLPARLRENSGSKQLRIWSAGCANGAEVYSIAILVHALLANELAQWNVVIVGSDINRVSLAEAEKGLYTDWTLRDVPEWQRPAFFARAGANWSIREKYKSNVQFVYHNLASDEFPSIHRNIFAFDIVLCRNVMIYFDEAYNFRLADRLTSVLADGAWLFTGPTDFNARLDDLFARERLPGTFAYRSRSAAPSILPARLPLATPEACALIRVEAHDANTASARTRPAFAATDRRANRRKNMPASNSGVCSNAERATPAMPAPTPQQPDIATIVELANKGDWPTAVRFCQALLKTDSCNAPAHYYYALVQHYSGAVAEAEQALKRAIYLDRNFALAHYQLGLVRKDAHDLARCRKSFRNALGALSNVPDNLAVSPCGQITALDLRELATHQLDLLGQT